MSDKRILFVSQEIAPYLPENEISGLNRRLPQAIQEKGFEVRTFMPKYGTVNERRNQLHEVIRLSGLNIIIDDNDHPLIIKVASLQPARIQVYFIDNDDYYQKSADDSDAVGSNRDDNDERAIFFARGTMETVKKLRWEPTIIHCSGWITAMTPTYLRRMYADDPSFRGAKIIYSVIPGEITGHIDPAMTRKLAADGISTDPGLIAEGSAPDTNTFHRLAIDCADGVIFHTDEPDADLLEFVKSKNIPYLTKQQLDGGSDAFAEFYNTLIPNEA